MARDLVQEFFEFRKLILSIDPPDDEGLDGTANATVANAEDAGEEKQVPMAAEDILIRLAPDRSLVPQSHTRSSDEEEDSADSDAGGASRLLLAQSAPQKRRGGRNSRGSRTSGVGGVTSTSKRKTSRQPRARSAYILSSESESEVESQFEEEESS
ncbi:hypothetical protein Aperf_G00000000216 [Anoplocephala perfoliata]